MAFWDTAQGPAGFRSGQGSVPGIWGTEWGTMTKLTQPLLSRNLLLSRKDSILLNNLICIKERICDLENSPSSQHLSFPHLYSGVLGVGAGHL